MHTIFNREYSYQTTLKFDSLCTGFDFADLILCSAALQLICKAGESKGAQQSGGFEAKLQIVRIFFKEGWKKSLCGSAISSRMREDDSISSSTEG